MTEEQKKRARVEAELLTEDHTAIDSWRVFKIIGEFVTGFELLRKYGRAVSVFGSARCGSGETVYEDARELASELVKRDFAIITGGGGGVMEAANRGAFEANGHSVGINISLPTEQTLNQYVTESEDFHYFFTRKVMLTFASEAYVFFPGGYGTLDEFFELATLIQTRKISPIPIVLVNQEFWTPLVSWLRTTLLAEHATISESDLDIFTLVDTVDEALAYIDANVASQEA